MQSEPTARHYAALSSPFLTSALASCFLLACLGGGAVDGSGGDNESATGGASSGGTIGSGGTNATGGVTGTGSQAGTGGEVVIIVVDEFVCGNASYDVNAPDADGDGYVDSTAWAYPVTPVECILENGGVESILPPDCDDSDPTVYHTGFESADGDEYGDVDRPVCYGAELPAGLATRVPDCDDTDPALGPWFLEDADEDGFGDARICALGPAVGITEQGGDCDDADAVVHPEGADIPGDEADTNCDGADGVYENPEDDLSWLPQPEILESSAPAEVCPATAGLDVIYYWLEHHCLWDEDDEFPIDATALAYASFKNTGGEATPAAVIALQSELDTEWTAELPIAPLEPGEVSPLYALGKVPVVVSMRFELPEQADCESVTLSTTVPHMCVTK